MNRAGYAQTDGCSYIWLQNARLGIQGIWNLSFLIFEGKRLLRTYHNHIYFVRHCNSSRALRVAKRVYLYIGCTRSLSSSLEVSVTTMRVAQLLLAIINNGVCSQAIRWNPSIVTVHKEYVYRLVIIQLVSVIYNRLKGEGYVHYFWYITKWDAHVALTTWCF